MTRRTIGKTAEAQTSAKAGRPEVASKDLDRSTAAHSEVVQRLARDDRPGGGDGRDAALTLQRLAGNRSVTRMLNRSVRDIAAAGFQGGSTNLPFAAKIQQSFGAHDIRGVRSFTGPGATAASRALSAEAYASGNNVVFADAAPSLHTAAHEAAHVVQQRAGIRIPGGMGTVGDAHERHADAVADKVVRGESAERSLDTYFSARTGGTAAAGGDGGIQRTFSKTLQADLHKGTLNKETRYSLILKKLNVAIAERNKNGDKLEINPDAVLMPMVYRLHENDGDTTYETYDHLIDALYYRGAILKDGQESGVEAVPKTEKLTLNLLLPGSADRRWRTFAENMIGNGVPTRKEMFYKMEEVAKKDPHRQDLGVEQGKVYYPTLYKHKDNDDKTVTYMLRGPGTFNAISSHPSNDIASNVKAATAIVESYIDDLTGSNLRLRVMGHSRNGVTTARIISGLRGKYPDLEIDAVLYDPVPGGDSKGFAEETLPHDEQMDKDVNSTVIYSLTDTRAGFNPMSVYGAKRLILTHYSHHAGIEPGFMYGHKQYKGLSLLALPAGVYIDEKQSPGMPNRLEGPYTDMENFEDVVVSALKDALVDTKTASNKNRLARIREVVRVFLKAEDSNK